jgi:hypothetical protein
MAEQENGSSPLAGRWTGSVTGIGQLSDQWSFLGDKRRSLWIAAEDCPDGVQVEEADLDVLLARLPVIAALRR